MSATRSQAGFTLVELMFSAVILLGVVCACLSTELMSTRTMSEAVVRSELAESACFALNQTAFEARWAERASFVVSSENGSTRLDLRVPEGMDDDEPIWSSTITYRVEPSPIDANGNGVPDEGRLVRQQDGETRTLCEGVTDGGFSASFTGNNLALQVSLAKMHRGRLVTSERATSSTVRN